MNIPTETKPRWERRKDERPQELLAAALDLFVDKGFSATRLSDVATRAGVSKGTLYLYFTNKEDLFKAVVREHLLPVLDEAEALVNNFSGHSAELFRNIMLGWWQRIGDTKLSGITKLMVAESGNFPELAQFYHQEMIVRGNAMIARILERGMERGEFRRIDARLTTQAIIAPMIMLMMSRHAFCNCQIKPVSPLDYLNNFVDLCLYGMLRDDTATAADSPQTSRPC
ncbi:TetR/AcrR family transcriptional regulator [Herminiimonas sp. CN]|uniref:TetR/AcrR family transcriptional regulator n=1 Tax=Herminiimonas sp. CN TaxID=1349818 RepID=UPI000473E2A6|nr:TetR/AcrR family transcriptional regulator [Herminiimonas sp. CN]